MSSTDLARQLRDLALSTQQTIDRPDLRQRCAEVVARFDEPLRVAFAGQTKAGKSTLLNALIGERVAATDHAECTRVVTWYSNGPAYTVTGEMIDGSRSALPFVRSNGKLQLDLDRRPPESIDRIVVTVPSNRLDSMTLIDTPGVGSLTEQLHRRSMEFFSAADNASPADAVVYLMRHAHDSDVRFLEAMCDDSQLRPSPVHAIGILSRADEVGSCRLDAMAAARRIAHRYAGHPRLTSLVHTVIPVCGLLAESAMTMTQHEFDVLTRIAAWPVTDFERATASVDDFVEGPDNAGGSEHERLDLLRRFGIYGTRLAVMLLRSRQQYTATTLADELVSRSGLLELRRLLVDLFANRGDLLKARSALRALSDVCDAAPEQSDALRRALEQIQVNAHELVELDWLIALRTADLGLTETAADDARRLLGDEGAETWRRLGCQPTTSLAEQMQLAGESHDRWNRRASSPLTRGEAAALCAAVIRSCEALIQPLNQSLTGPHAGAV
jgi:Dynamin family